MRPLSRSPSNISLGSGSHRLERERGRDECENLSDESYTKQGSSRQGDGKQERSESGLDDHDGGIDHLPDERRPVYESPRDKSRARSGGHVEPEPLRQASKPEILSDPQPSEQYPSYGQHHRHDQHQTYSHDEQERRNGQARNKKPSQSRHGKTKPQGLLTEYEAMTPKPWTEAKTSRNVNISEPFLRGTDFKNNITNYVAYSVLIDGKLETALWSKRCISLAHGNGSHPTSQCAEHQQVNKVISGYKSIVRLDYAFHRKVELFYDLAKKHPRDGIMLSDHLGCSNARE